MRRSNIHHVLEASNVRIARGGTEFRSQVFSRASVHSYILIVKIKQNFKLIF